MGDRGGWKGGAWRKGEESGPTEDFDQKHRLEKKQSATGTPPPPPRFKWPLNSFIYLWEWKISQTVSRWADSCTVDPKYCLHPHTHSRNQPRPTGSDNKTETLHINTNLFLLFRSLKQEGNNLLALFFFTRVCAVPTPSVAGKLNKIICLRLADWFAGIWLDSVGSLIWWEELSFPTHPQLPSFNLYSFADCLPLSDSSVSLF